MPLLIKDYTWSETDSHVYITVPLKGANPRKTDVHVNDVYLKINFPPNFFELDLYEPIDTDNSVATIGNDCAKLELPKQNPVKWGTVKYLCDDPAALKARREEADARFRKRAEDAREAKSREKREQERLLVQKQIEVERAERERVEALKAAEKKRAEEEMQAWVEKTKVQENATSHVKVDQVPESKIMEIFDEEDTRDDGYISDDEHAPASLSTLDNQATATEEVDEDEEDLDDETGLDMEEIRAKVRAQLNRRVIPPPRDVNREITITFTPRGLIPTKTARESEDAKWRMRIKAMQDEHHCKTQNPDARNMEETSPIFLKDKGNNFYKSGNYPAAVNAYTAALDIEPTNLTCLSNRAACHLQMDSYDLCTRDCTAALSLLDKEEDTIRDQLVEDGGAEQRRKSRVKLLVRMGTAKLRAEDLEGGIYAYEKALELDPRNDQLRNDVQNLRQQI